MLSSSASKDFFTRLFGFRELAYAKTQKRLMKMARFEAQELEFYPRERCTFEIGKRSVSAGLFSMPSVGELQQHVDQLYSSLKERNLIPNSGVIRLSNCVGEARDMHCQLKQHAVVQAASQFNLLEMVGPGVTPEKGITGYEFDRTQGPACAIACASGTAYRNYLVPVVTNTGEEQQRGQTKGHQINTLQDIETYLEEQHGISEPWRVKNGYVESAPSLLQPVNDLLEREPAVADEMIRRLRIGVQQDCQVTDDADSVRLVTQTYNSAISISYSLLSTKRWEPVAKVVLNGTYKATFLVGVLEYLRAIEEGREPQPIFLTKVGGGVFGNEHSWIVQSMGEALHMASSYELPLDVRIVHYGCVDPESDAFVDMWSSN
ncbi:expressed unknown protein [Seminavis robusta]|uniref:Uncharacterized protein n=1 Tax=Seminavis robusta TaxID=568900 RepID=A0A9N8GZZ6_9STRA|nr:expressed unknown protein [Seminavis robusta]|eukprot:Sro11_g008880.1 n/a (376) ;mRNA; f:180433-181560